MHGKFKLEVYKLVFPGAGVHGIKWSGRVIVRDQVVFERSGESINNIDSLFADLKTWFGGELKDLNNEMRVEIKTGPDEIVGDNFMADKKYCLHEALDKSERMHLLELLDQMEVAHRERQYKFA